MTARVLPLLTLGIALSSLGFSGCSSDVDGAAVAPVGTAKSAVIKGKASTSAQDAVVLIVNVDRSTHRFGQCTGTLLAPNLVLTARHCVADTDESAACEADGTPLFGGEVRSNFKAETFYIFTGKDRPEYGPGLKPAGQGAKIVDDGGKNLCNHDIALIVLKEPITDMPIAPIRLDAEVEKGEVLTAVGWGVTEKSPMPDVRQQRTGVKIDTVGPKDGMPAVPSNEFEVGEAICSGDSGGPALAAETNAVIGVVSRGGNASGEQDPNDPASNCIDGRNLYTKISPFKDTIMKAFELAAAEPWVEGGADPRLAKTSEACAEAAECRSNICLADPSQAGATTCAQDCSVDPCAEGLVCTAEGDVKVCRPPTTTTTTSKSGCSSSSGTAGSGGVAALLALAACVTVARRRRQQ